MPRTPSSPAEAMTAFMGIVGSAKESLRKILIRGEFDEYLNDHQMHCTARLVEMLNLYSNELHKCSETSVIYQTSRPKSYIKNERAVYRWVTEIIQMEKMTDYTCNPNYMSEWSKLMNQQDTFRGKILIQGHSKAKIDGIGEVEAGHIKAHQDVLHQAFDLKMRMTAYWKIVLSRLVDSMALHLQFCVQNLVNKEMEKEIISELMSNQGGVIERMMEESPSIAAKREKLNKSIKLLGESKKVLGNIMDKIATYSD
ncbi:hypothetical protein GH714_010568 [Hevea brasiliensis]|uniref:GED domain-containing protein n=1 Tax=Hevea brasiliensis TaxID=3981 RepID=A0A6A6MI22_HEVBR|nr:hypothetical protein GH714_010568 [Hevea brasiliensis]